MTEYVIDCSFAMCWLYQDEANSESDRVYKELQEGTSRAVIPSLFYLELANTLCKGESRGRNSSEESERFVRTVFSLPLVVHGVDQEVLLAITRLARQYHLSAYDAAYLHLSTSRGLPLFSRDEQLMRAFKAASVTE